jgi:flavin-dependent dehydrogenase
MPTNDGATCVYVGGSSARVRDARRRHGSAAFDHLLAETFPGLHERVRDAGEAGRTWAWGGVPGIVRRAWGHGWALVGDAGYFKDPITTHGMSDALRDAELLARAAVPVLADPGAATPRRHLPERLRRYQLERDRLSRDLFEVTDEVAAFDWDVSEIRTLLRRVSAAMSDEVDALSCLPPLPGARATVA